MLFTFATQSRIASETASLSVRAPLWTGSTEAPGSYSHGVNPAGVRINGTTTARRAIITLPVGVMKAGAVAFWPGVGDHALALSSFAMGHVVNGPANRDLEPASLEEETARGGESEHGSSEGTDAA